MGTVSGLVDGATGVAGLAAKASGAATAAQARKSALQYQASVADQNAIIDQDKATVVQNNEQSSQQINDLHAAQVFGQQRANLGANNVDLGSGSANELLASTKLTQALDDQTMQTNALYQAWGYTNAASQQTDNANFLRASADTINPTLAGVQSLLSSAPAVSSAWNALAGTANGIGSGIGGLSKLFAPISTTTKNTDTTSTDPTSTDPTSTDSLDLPLPQIPDIWGPQ